LPVGVRNYGSVPEQRFRYIPRCSSSCSSSSERWRACSPDVGPTVARRTSRSWCCATSSGCSSARRVGPDSKHQTGCSSRRRAAASRESDGRRRWLHRRPCCDGTANSCAGSGPTGTPSHQGVPQLPQRSGSWCSGSLARTPDGDASASRVSSASSGSTWVPRPSRMLLRKQGLGPAPRQAGPSWAEFLRAQAQGVVACDLFAVETLWLSTKADRGTGQREDGEVSCRQSRCSRAVTANASVPFKPQLPDP
jgi:hypothetical protein